MAEDQRPARPRGRPPKYAGEGKRQTFAFRIRDVTRDRLIQAVAESGRSLSEEIEYRIEKSFNEPEHVERLLQMIAGAIRYCELVNGYKYTEHSDTQRQCRLAINAILDQFMHEGVREPDPDVRGRIFRDGVERPDMEVGHAAADHVTGPDFAKVDTEGDETKRDR